MRMDAYYYGFNPTGVGPVDKILSAVACAGKAYHHTKDWGEAASYTPHTGACPVEWIQNAAKEAAAFHVELLAELKALRAKSRDELKQQNRTLLVVLASVRAKLDKAIAAAPTMDDPDVLPTVLDLVDEARALCGRREEAMSELKVCRCGHQQVMHRAQVGCMAAHPSDETACCPCPAFEDDQMLSRAELLAELKALPRP